MKDKDELITAHITLALGQHALRHSAALVILKPDGYVDVGSATCVSVGGRFLLATAGHNFDEVRSDDQIRIVPPNRGVDEPVPFIARHSSRQRGDSAVDIAWLELDSQIAAEEGLAAIPIDSFKPFENHDESALYLVQGLPVERAIHKTLDSLRRITLISVGYLTIPSGHAPVDPDVDISLEYEGAAVLADGRKEIEMAHPKGMSGGGIWAIEKAIPTIWDPSRCHFVGIVRSYLESRRQLFGVQIQHWLHFVAQDFPDLAGIINEVLGKYRQSGDAPG